MHFALFSLASAPDILSLTALLIEGRLPRSAGTQLDDPLHRGVAHLTRWLVNSSRTDSRAPPCHILSASWQGAGENHRRKTYF